MAMIVAVGAPSVQAFPWSIDMFRGAAIQPLEVAPRVMPDGVLPVDGIHYNHPGQPAGLPGADDQAVPRMKLESRTVRMRNPLPATPANLMHGEQFFLTNCSPCHGIGGAGDGTVARLLKHEPDNLTKNASKNRPDGYIYVYIRNGRIRMPAYNDAMSSSERWEVILYLRHLQAITEMRRRAPRALSSETNSPANEPAFADSRTDNGNPEVLTTDLSHQLSLALSERVPLRCRSTLRRLVRFTAPASQASAAVSAALPA